VGDQLLKYFSVTQQKDFFIWSKKLGFVFNVNPDIAFNIRIPHYGFLIGAIVLFSIFTFQYISAWRKRERVLIWGYGLFLVGALSNLIDRFIYGYVVDYFFFAPFSYLNLADVAIVAGGLIFLVEIVRNQFFKHKSRKKSS
jgi:lipoprotein signal peptidase